MSISSRSVIARLSILLTVAMVLSLAAPLAEASKRRSNRPAKRSIAASKRSSKKVSGKKRKVSRRMSRRARQRWLQQLAYARAVRHQSKIQNSLTEAWSAAHTAPEFGRPGSVPSGPSVAEPDTAPAGSPVTAPPLQPTKPADPAAAGETEEILLNPLVEAFAESLAARGYAADNQGFIVESMRGEVLAEHNADVPFNPASVVKIATSLVAIARLGPEHKFRTVVYTDGSLDPATQTL